MVKFVHVSAAPMREGFAMSWNASKALVMRKIASMARKLGLKVAAGDLHLGAVWCKTEGGVYRFSGCMNF